MSEIQEHGLARIERLADEVAKEVIRLIAEIGRDHWNIDDDLAWAIAFGNTPSFVAFRVMGNLRVIVDEILPDLASTLREAATVTDADLMREWREIWLEAQSSHDGAVH